MLATNFSLALAAGRHVGLDPAGQDRVGGDAVARMLDRERARQRVQRRLCRGVILVARHAVARGDARRRDEAAEAVAALGALDHVPERGLEDEKDAVEIDREHAPPVVLGAVEEGLPAVAPHARIGETAVDPAEGFESRGESVLDRRALGHVARPRFDRRPVFAQFGQRVAVLLRVAAPDRDRTAGARESLGHAEADPAIAARDDRRPARKIEIARH